MMCEDLVQYIHIYIHIYIYCDFSYERQHIPWYPNAVWEAIGTAILTAEGLAAQA